MKQVYTIKVSWLQVCDKHFMTYSHNMPVVFNTFAENCMMIHDEECLYWYLEEYQLSYQNCIFWWIWYVFDIKKGDAPGSPPLKYVVCCVVALPIDSISRCTKNQHRRCFVKNIFIDSIAQPFEANDSITARTWQHICYCVANSWRYLVCAFRIVNYIKHYIVQYNAM